MLHRCFRTPGDLSQSGEEILSVWMVLSAALQADIVGVLRDRLERVTVTSQTHLRYIHRVTSRQELIYCQPTRGLGDDHELVAVGAIPEMAAYCAVLFE
jgi:hypothetical protein